MAWNHKEYELSKSGFTLPTFEGEQGLKDRLREEEKKRDEARFKARMRQAAEEAARRKADQKLQKKQAAKAQREAKRQARTEKRFVSAAAPAPVRGGAKPAPASSGGRISAPSSGEGASFLAGALGLLMIVSIIVALVQWMHAKVAASILALTGLGGMWPGAIVLALALLLSLGAVFIAYHNHVRGRRIWTRDFALWLVAPAALFTGFSLVSFFL